ncbi:SMC family ATPase [Nonomuraea sp. B1E8]|uniref:SMC family ATPase n=1 Tax=unclassified Nonomuraea TaxID=2593643 RepID=UPI00325C9B2C
MRPHRLTFTAFGSFPGTETVDFDALAEAGLFLVHGPTGAGKTTILDALCFALYGQVPGQRNSARSLRCDHAPPTTGPAVTLEVTIRGRLLRIQRSPTWQRPKLRGTGFTEEKAKVVVSERRGSSWQGLTTRLDEAGHLVGELLGMNADQFCQVAMLPQGEFAKFLRAGGDERAKLLERLFTVKIFTQAEAWLAEHRKRAWREAQELRQQVDFAIKRVEEAAGDALLAAPASGPSASPSYERGAVAAPGGGVTAQETGGEGFHGTGEGTGGEEFHGTGEGTGGEGFHGTGEGTSGEESPEAGRHRQGSGSAADQAGDAELLTPEADPLRWAGALLDAARAVVRGATEEQAAAGQALRSARLRHEQAASLADRRRRHAEALTLRRTLDERADERADLQAMLDDAARADRVIPLVTAAGQRAEAATKARALAADALARARPLLTTTPPAPGTDRPTPGSPSSGRPTDHTPDPARQGDDAAAELAVLERERQAEIARLSELLTEEARLSVVRRDLLRVEGELAALVEADESVAERLAVLPGLVERAERVLAEARTDAARIPAAQAVRDAAAHLIEIDDELAGLAAELAELSEREAEVFAAQAELPGRIADADAALADVRAQAAAIPAAAASLDAARLVLEAAHRRESLAAELDAAVASHQVLVDQAQTLRERWLDLRQARIDGMAAELARDLADGQPCAVCGSDHHPAPAAPAPSAPSADDEHAAETEHEAALAEREAAERALASLESRHADAVEATGGLGVAEAEEQVLRAEEEVARLEAVAAREPALADELDRVETEREQVRDRAMEIAEILAGHRAHLTHLRSERARLQARLATTGLAGPPGPAGALPSSGAAHNDPAAREGADHGDGRTGERRDDAVAASVAGGGGSHGAQEVDGAVVLAEAEKELRRLRESAGREDELAREAARLHRERQDQEEERRRVGARLAACRTKHEELSGDAARLGARLDAARDGDPTLTARLARLGDEAELLREAREATQVAAAAHDELTRARQAAEEAAAEAGFADVAEAAEAVRSPAERERKAELLRRLDDEHAAVMSILADPELVAAAAEPAPDLAAIEAERDALEEAHTRLSSVRDRAVARAARLEELHGELAGRLERWRPAADRHRLAERLAALAGGTSSDNRWSMSLSSFVLGERLRQVVDAANERLDHMSGGRYLLRHDLRKTAGSRARSGGGLGLRVADGWTGVDRDPATLSGGESFITSLALALGLADVVTAEAGGAELGMLFVDEGFGTLDEDTLDSVLDILDGLRDGGRAVGIVSHVAELRSRIPARLKVTKTRTGSTLASVGAG